MPSTLTSLNLEYIREGHLSQILSATTGLKTLHWDWYYREDLANQFVTPIIDLDNIVESMSHVRDTLTDLVIKAGCDTTQGPEPGPLTIKGSMRAIVNFNMLKRFEVPVPFLLGFSQAAAGPLEHVIPRNVEFLTITDDLRLHDLRGIALLLRHTDDEWGPVMRRELKELCAGIGIGCEITKLLRDMGPPEY